MNTFMRCALVVSLSLFLPIAWAAPPQTINYQGFLTNAGGTPVNNMVSITFRLYNVASGGAALYAETQPSVNVVNGAFSTLIGSVTPIPLPFDGPYWLSIAVNPDAEMTPRQTLASSAYAFRAAAADSVSAGAAIAGSQITGSIATATIPVANVVGALTGPVGPQGPAGPIGPQGPPGTNGTGSSGDITGNLTMLNSTASAGNILKAGALFAHNFGVGNTFIGEAAGNLTMSGNGNTGSGASALAGNTTGIQNTATGEAALRDNTTGFNNTATGRDALRGNLTGNDNVANGSSALLNTTTGNANTASGAFALFNNTTGSGNIAIGRAAGTNLTTGFDNIAIGNAGATGESRTLRIGSNQLRAFIAGIRDITPAVSDAMPVVIDSQGQLGTALGNAGTVTSVSTGAGLAGGPITGSGTINLAATNLLPTTACNTAQIPKWNGNAWQCAQDASVPAGGTAGQLLQMPGGTPAWTSSPVINGNLTLASPSTATAGNILKGASPFMHNSGVQNTFLGENAGNFALTGANNTGIGWEVLLSITTGYYNTATGSFALSNNSSGFNNTASGGWALMDNTTGYQNTAMGSGALYQNSTGYYNTAIGSSALAPNLTGSNNTAVGFNVNVSAKPGNQNTAVGASAHQKNAGSSNIAIGYMAGNNLTSGSYNIDIGNAGVAAESATIRIGDVNQTRTFISGIRGVNTALAAIPVLIDTDGQLGTISSSRRVKDNITDMDSTSSALMKLRPVTFHYKSDQNPSGRTLQYGLVAEEVADVYPGLVAHSADGQIETVMYQHLPPMLLNEFQKQQRTIATQAAELAQQRARISALEQQSARVEMLERELQGIRSLLANR